VRQGVNGEEPRVAHASIIEICGLCTGRGVRLCGAGIQSLPRVRGSARDDTAEIPAHFPCSGQTLEGGAMLPAGTPDTKTVSDGGQNFSLDSVYLRVIVVMVLIVSVR
jgi:hypothetical protein